MIPVRPVAFLSASCLFFACALQPAPARAAGEVAARDFAVRAGTVITVSGAELRPGTLIIRDGRFTAVGGAEVAIPRGLPVVDFGERVVMPGFIEAHTQRGLDRVFERADDASFVRVTDAVNPVSLDVEDARRNGITTMLIAPDDRTLLGGRGAILHPQGIAIDSMIVKDDAALKISLVPARGSSRMGHLARLREALDDTRRFLDEREKERKERGAGAKAKDIEPTRQPLVDLIEGRMPAWVTCPTAADVAAILGLAKEHGFHVTLIVAPEAWRAAPLLRSNNLTVIVPPVFESFEQLADGTVIHVNLPQVLHEHGVPFALTTEPSDATAQHPWYQAARAARVGVPRAAALASVTSVPAKLLGFGKRKGAIAEGADADFVVLSADPFAATAWVDESYIRGTRIYDRSVDEKLTRLLGAAPEPPLGAVEIDHEENESDDPEGFPPADALSHETTPEASPITLDPDTRLRWPSAPQGRP